MTAVIVKLKSQLFYILYISLAFLLVFTFLVPTLKSHSLESKNVVSLIDLPNRNLMGVFYDLNLENSLDVDGRLWKVLEDTNSLSQRLTWFIDPMLIEEIQDLADGFTTIDGANYPASKVATDWLRSLELAIAGDEVVALHYGNPPTSWLNYSAPTERRIHLNLSRQRLTELLSREISSRDLLISTTIPVVSPFIAESYSELRREIRTISRYAKNPVTRGYRLGIGSILNPDFNPDLLPSFIQEYQDAINKYKKSVRISPGKFTLTSEREKIPLTLINDFTNDMTVIFQVFPSNSKIIVGKINEITIPAESKIFLTLPIQVLTSGSSDVLMTLRTPKGIRLGDEVRLPLTLTVISPLTTWITTGSGVILLLAAIIQSLRRIRRSKRKAQLEVDHV